MQNFAATGALHAVILLSLGAGTLFLCTRFFARPSLRRVLGALALGLTVAVVSLSVSLHRCREGNPVSQWAIPCVCIVLSVMFVRQERIRTWACIAAAVASIALSLNYVSVVHGDRYVGGTFPETRHEWHSWLTGLYVRAPQLSTYRGPRFSFAYPTGLEIVHADTESVQLRASTGGQWPHATSMIVSTSSSARNESFTSDGGSHVMTYRYDVARDGVRIEYSTERDTDDFFESEQSVRDELRRVANRTIASFRRTP